MSGYTGGALASILPLPAAGRRDTALVEKPFERDVLLAAVDALLSVRR